MAQTLGSADALMIADDGDSVVATADALTAAGANLRNIQMLGTGLWDNPRVFASQSLQGGLYAAPDPSGFRAFSGRYRTRFGADPVRTATLAYDAVALVAALARTQGAQRFAPETLTNPSGFAGIDGLFRFRSDGTNERGPRRDEGDDRRRRAGRGLAEEFWGVDSSSAREWSRPGAILLCMGLFSRFLSRARRSSCCGRATPPDPPRPHRAPGKPSLVTRRRPSASTEIAPSSRNSAMRFGSSERPDSA